MTRLLHSTLLSILFSLFRIFFSDISYPDFALPAILRIGGSPPNLLTDFDDSFEHQQTAPSLSSLSPNRPHTSPSSQRPSRHPSSPPPSSLPHQQLLATQEERTLRRHAAVQAEWDAFKQRTALKLGVRPNRLNLHQSDLYRAKVEEFDLIAKSIPASERLGAGREDAWQSSLRGTGDAYISIGGLNTRVRTDTNPKVEIVRRVNHKI